MHGPGRGGGGRAAVPGTATAAQDSPSGIDMWYGEGKCVTQQSGLLLITGLCNTRVAPVGGRFHRESGMPAAARQPAGTVQKLDGHLRPHSYTATAAVAYVKLQASECESDPWHTELLLLVCSGGVPGIGWSGAPAGL
jgi:hypothetical protein